MGRRVEGCLAIVVWLLPFATSNRGMARGGDAIIAADQPCALR
jgi:hypothetical protein